MLRYVCPNPNCLHTFLSPDFLKYKKCDKCGCLLSRIGKRDNGSPPSHENESIEELKKEFVRLTEKARRIGLLDHECIIRGRAIRKITFEIRKELLKDAGLWQEGFIYKHVMIDGLFKMVPDKRKMYYDRKKNEI